MKQQQQLLIEDHVLNSIELKPKIDSDLEDWLLPPSLPHCT